MFIKYIELENWKCFKNKTKFEFDKHQLIKWKNGQGKSSLMEAINYVIWQKLPVGFNLNSIRNDENKPCTLFICFNHSNNEITIERTFGCRNASGNCYNLYFNGKLICESARSIDEYMNKIINSKIAGQLWTNNLSTSDILDERFFTTNILNDILEDSQKLVASYTSKTRANNKMINGFESELKNLIDIDDVKSKMDNIQSKLKKLSSSKDVNLNLANSARDAEEKLGVLFLSDSFMKYKDKLKNIDSEIDQYMSNATKFLKLYKQKDSFEKSLEEELKKKDNRYSLFNKTILQKMLQFNNENGICYLCGNEATKECNDKIKDEIENCGRSEEKIAQLKENLEFINSMTLEEAEIIGTINDLKNTIKRCPDWKKILDEVNEENDKLWEEFNNYQNLYSTALKQQEKLKLINEAKVENEQNSFKLQVLHDYISKAKKYYTSKLMKKASISLKSMNSRYQGIYLTENGFEVLVQSDNASGGVGVFSLLPVARLSSGEKTMCALSLLFATHSLVVPELPLIFDETFAALDKDNLTQIQKFLRMQVNTQIFIITHDQNWEEF